MFQMSRPQCHGVIIDCYLYRQTQTYIPLKHIQVLNIFFFFKLTAFLCILREITLSKKLHLYALLCASMFTRRRTACLLNATLAFVHYLCTETVHTHMLYLTYLQVCACMYFRLNNNLRLQRRDLDQTTLLLV